MMRLIVIILIGSLAWLEGQSQNAAVPPSPQIKWMSWQEAVEANKKEPRKMFIDIYTYWCGWCKRMDATTFKNPVIIDYMNQNYYAIKMNAEMKDTIVFNKYQFVNANPTARRSAHQLPASLLDNKMSYPSFVIMNQQVQRLQALPGYKTSKQLEPVLNYFAKDKHLDTPYDQFAAKFQGKVE